MKKVIGFKSNLCPPLLVKLSYANQLTSDNSKSDRREMRELDSITTF